MKTATKIAELTREIRDIQERLDAMPASSLWGSWASHLIAKQSRLQEARAKLER